MTSCQTCNKGFPQAYAIYPRESDGRLECNDCFMARGRASASDGPKEQLKRLNPDDWARCTHGPGDGLCQCEPPAEHPEGY